MTSVGLVGDRKVTRRHIAPLNSRHPFHGNMSLSTNSSAAPSFCLQEKPDSSQVSLIPGGKVMSGGCVISVSGGKIIDSTLCCLSYQPSHFPSDAPPTAKCTPALPDAMLDQSICSVA